MRTTSSKWLVVLAALTTLGAACASDESGRPISTSERTALNGIVVQLETAKGLVAMPTDGDSILAALSFEDFESLLSPVSKPARPRNFPPPADCAATDPATMTATFTMCEYMGHTVDGTVTLAGDVVTADLTDVFDTTAGQMGTATLTGTVTINETTIDGSATVVLDFSDAGEAHDLMISATFADLDFTGCPDLPKAGVLTLVGSGTIGTRTIDATRTITFGPACGDATIE